MIRMETKTKLENALKQAMRANNDVRKRVIRMALSAIHLVEVEKGASLDENAVMAVIQKEVKSQQEAIADAERASRPDLIASAQAEIAILEEYLPKPFTPQELENLTRKAIQECGATSLKEMGQVMKVLMPKLEGRASGEQSSAVVRKLLE